MKLGLFTCLTSALLCASVCTGPAFAHTRSQSYSAWRVDGGDVTLTFRVSSLEVTRLGLLEDAGPDLDASLVGHLSDRISVAVGDAPCTPSSAPRALVAANGYRKVEWGFACPPGSTITISNDAFFEVAPSHIHYARMRAAGAVPVEYIFTNAERRRLVVSSGAAENAPIPISLTNYVWLGIVHIMTGFDHLAFLCVLLMLCRAPGEIVRLVTGFTLGHSITLALSALGMVHPNVGAIEALIGFTVALVAAENVAVSARAGRSLAISGVLILVTLIVVRIVALQGLPVVTLAGVALFTACYLPLATSRETAARHRLGLTLMFGLIHGFGFANVLMEIGLPAARLPSALFAFNLGVEAGQLAIVVVVSAAVATLGPFIGPSHRRWLADASSAAVFGLGVYWFVQRSFLL